MSVCIACAATLPPNKSQCLNCGKWNIVDTGPIVRKPVRLTEVPTVDVERLVSGPWDVSFGGGIVTDSVALLAGEPGAGKSTLLLQMANKALATDLIRVVLYVATEENERQIADRAKRLALEYAYNIIAVNAMGGIDLTATIKSVNPGLIILDSLPGFTGSGTHKDESLRVIGALKQHAEQSHCPSIVIDHITKDDDYAGYKALQHAVDTLLRLDMREEQEGFRVLYAKKNRHGAVPAKVKFFMTGRGLVTEEPEIVKHKDRCVCGHVSTDHKDSEGTCQLEHVGGTFCAYFYPAKGSTR